MPFLKKSELSPIVKRQANCGLLEKIGRGFMKKLLIEITAFVLLAALANTAMAAKQPKDKLLADQYYGMGEGAVR